MQIHGKQIKDATVKAAKIDFSGFTPSNDFDPVTKKFLEDNKLVVAPASAPYLQIQGANNNELFLKALAITDVHVDTTAVDLAAFVAASYTVGNEYQEGDTIILTAATGGTKIYLHNGDTTLGAADFTEIERPDLTDSYIRNLLGNGNGLSYNPATGEFAVVDSYIRGLVSGNGLIGYNPANGQFSLSEATVRGLLSQGTGIVYDPLTGQVSVDTTVIASRAYVDAAITAAAIPDSYIRGLFVDGNGLDYNAATGTFSTDDAYIRALISGIDGVTYNPLTGVARADFAVVASRTYVDDQIIANTVASPTSANRAQNPFATVGNGQDTGITIAHDPRGFVLLAVNGKLESIGNGVKTQRAYFSADNGLTARTYETISAGDRLYWNGIVAGYDLDANDTVDLFYLEGNANIVESVKKDIVFHFSGSLDVTDRIMVKGKVNALSFTRGSALTAGFVSLRLDAAGSTETSVSDPAAFNAWVTANVTTPTTLFWVIVNVNYDGARANEESQFIIEYNRE